MLCKLVLVSTWGTRNRTLGLLGAAVREIGSSIRRIQVRVRNKTSSKSRCMVKMKLSYEYDRYWQLDAAVIDYVNLVHNHPLLSPKEAKNHRSHKVKDPGFLQYIDQL
jgi:hypothetical protein